MNAQLLSPDELTALLVPFGASSSVALAEELATLVYDATMLLCTFVTREIGADLSKQDEQQGRRFLKRIAADPARALAAEPSGWGEQSMFAELLRMAEDQSLDIDSRAGAAAIGDLAGSMLLREHLLFPPLRAGAYLSQGGDLLYEDVCRAMLAVDPHSLDVLPSNASLDRPPRAPAIQFADSFIEIVVGRAREYLRSANRDLLLQQRIETFLSGLTAAVDRTILDGVRAVRQRKRGEGEEL